MPGDLHHVAVFVNDLDRALHLFRNLLGFEVAWRLPKVGGRVSEVTGIPGMEAEIVYLQGRSRGTALELVRIIRTPTEKNTPGNGIPGSVVLSFVVEDLDGLHRLLSNEGWTPFTQPVEMMSPDGGPIRMFCFPAEDGLTVELIETKK